MADEGIARIVEDPRYRALVRQRGRFTWALTAVMLVAYFGFVLLIAFDKPFLAQPVAGGVMSLGIVLGFALILLAIVLTGVSVRRANRVFDPLVAGLAGDYGA